MYISSTDELKLKDIESKYNNICNLLTYQEVLMDVNLCLNYQKQKNILEPIVLKYQQFECLKKNIEKLQNTKNSISTKEIDLVDDEIEDIKIKLAEIKSNVIKLLKEFNAQNSSIIVEVLSKQKNKLFFNLIDGYKNFCKQNSLKCVIQEIKNGISLQVYGLNAKNYFKNEIGIHATFDKQESCQVFVFDKIEQDKFDIDDVEFSTMRSSGAGGQHINTTDSAIRATHKKTGLVCVCQNERSQFQNKQKALENLKEKVESFYANQVEKSIKSQKEKQLKGACKIQTKIYDYANNKIEKFELNKIEKQKTIIKISDFLQGKAL